MPRWTGVGRVSQASPFASFSPLIRRVGQTLDSLGVHLQGKNAFVEKRTCLGVRIGGVGSRRVWVAGVLRDVGDFFVASRVGRATVSGGCVGSLSVDGPRSTITLH